MVSMMKVVFTVLANDHTFKYISADIKNLLQSAQLQHEEAQVNMLYATAKRVEWGLVNINGLIYTTSQLYNI